MAIAVITIAAGPDGPPLAASAAAHVVAQVAFALAFATVVVRRGGRAGFAAAAGAFALVSLPLALLPQPLAIAAAVPALALAPRAIPVAPPRDPRVRPVRFAVRRRRRLRAGGGRADGAAVLRAGAGGSDQRVPGIERDVRAPAHRPARPAAPRRPRCAACCAGSGATSGFCVAVALGFPPVLRARGLQLHAKEQRAARRLGLEREPGARIEADRVWVGFVDVELDAAAAAGAGAPRSPASVSALPSPVPRA